MNIIGISGRRDDGSTAGAGKDEVAKILVKQGYVVVALADELKRTVMRWYDFSVEQVFGALKEEPDPRYPREHGPWADRRCMCCGLVVPPFVAGMAVKGTWLQCYLTPRFAMKWIGTECGRTLYDETWTRLALATAKKLLTTTTAQYSQSRGLWQGPSVPGFRVTPGVVVPDVRWPTGSEGRAIKAAGGQLWRVDRPGAGRAGTSHDSETQPAPDEAFTVILHNDGSLEDLEAQVLVALAHKTA